MAVAATYSQQKRLRIRSTVIAAVAVVVLALCVWLYVAVDKSIKAQSCDSLRDTILASASQCFAIEGTYPPSLEYLEQNYGLVVNTTDYLVSYEAFAQNIAPTVMVSMR